MCGCVCVWRLTLLVLRAARAIELAKEPAVRLSGGITGEELAVWEMDLEIAIIQSRIYESIKQNTSGAVPEAERVVRGALRPKGRVGAGLLPADGDGALLPRADRLDRHVLRAIEDAVAASRSLGAGSFRRCSDGSRPWGSR